MEQGVPCPAPAAKLTPPVKKSQDMHDERTKLVNEYACRVLELLGMGHRLFVPRLLATSKEDLLQADFEGALKFFRVQLPKRYRAEENARRLMEQACNIKDKARKACLGSAFLSLRDLESFESSSVHSHPTLAKYCG
ncbi:Rab GTPase-activating protein 1 [Myotis brandtii]|uniref:Rab GTPase-activating protein 1 n=1 Tax=Myotis brandtii TaxID=109478 RepID=S7PKP6_MYOBR|nr:Rab GTPase-activating protein 1 [Myotis brandtii]